MVKQIQLESRIEFSCRLICEGRNVSSNPSRKHTFELPLFKGKDLHCEIELFPHKIQPIVRYDNILMNYGLAGIKPWDHMLEFTIKDNFFDHYFQKIVDSKKEYLGVTKTQILSSLGLYNRHDDLIKQIQDKIS